MSGQRQGSQGSLITYRSQLDPDEGQSRIPISFQDQLWTQPPSPELQAQDEESSPDSQSPKSLSLSQSQGQIPIPLPFPDQLRTQPPSPETHSPKSRNQSYNQSPEKNGIDHRDIREPPSTPRVRFRSSVGLTRHYPSSESVYAEAEKSRRHDMPHRMSAPFEHGSTDIADTPLSQRSTAAEYPPRQSHDSIIQKEKDKPEDETQESEKPLKTRLHDMITNARRRTSVAMTHLGREQEGDDDLQPSVYTTEWMQDEIARSRAKRRQSEIDQDRHGQANSEAHRLVRAMNEDQSAHRRRSRGKPYSIQGMDTIQAGMGGSTSISEGGRFSGGGVLSQLMRLQNPQEPPSGAASSEVSLTGTPSGATTPRKERPKWYRRPTTSPVRQAGGTISGASTPIGDDTLSAASKRRSKQSRRKTRLEDEIRVTIHIAEIIARQRYIMQLCRALMRFGAPTHRLEEYMQMTAQVLEVESQYLYLPGCMIMAFDDPSTRTTEVKLVRVSQGIDLCRLANTHNVYKNVVHDIIGVEEATQDLEEIMDRKPRFNKWFVVFVYGLATATVGPFAFDARPIDMPIIFFNGCLLGFMQHIVAPRSVLYSNVFEVTGSVLTSFLARAFGSIPGKVVDGRQQFLFCFSAISQSSIALILPGFLVLCSSLELQSHQIAAGSIRMVYAIIYSLFLGYGITVGTTIYGLIHRNATSETTCSSVGAFPNPYVQRFPFVAIMVVWLVIVNQGRFKQIPPMLVIAMAGYVTNYFCTETLGSNSQVANTVGAFTIGVIGNLYSRLWHGHAATAILPGIFVLVPSGLAATGSLISGVHSADEIRSNVSTSSGHKNAGTGSSQDASVTNLGYGMIQVAIGITIGLFLAALVIYPYGKRRSGLFSF